MDIHQPDRKRGRARARVSARRQMVVPNPEMRDVPSDDEAVVPIPRTVERRHPRRPPDPSTASTRKERIKLLLKDAWWYTLNRPHVLQGVGIAIIALFVLFVLSHLITGRIFPNIWALGVNLGDLTTEEAAEALQAAWNQRITIQLVDGERTWSASPAELGLRLDAEATASAARGAGMSGMPMGYVITPVVTLEEFTAQDYLLNLTERANYAPYNAGYEWVSDTLVGVPGRDGRVLDVGTTLESLKNNPERVAESRRFDLAMSPIPPEVTDPEPYLEQARVFLSQDFTLTGYDPFRDEETTWTTDRNTLATWLEAEEDGLGLRETVFATFIEAQNTTLAQVDALRYLEPTETMDKVEDAIRDGSPAVNLRVRYKPTQYEVVSGDTGYRIARKTGLPFILIDNVNPGFEWNTLAPGDIVNLPTRDLTLPIDPVVHKRIIVNLDTQYLMAYENDQLVFEWSISSGLSSYPTYPGVFQILSHEEEALGSTFELCGASGCGQWTMYWFMGIYEVVPGLMNGFHGAVLLPNGRLLGDGAVGSPFTYGCVMSTNENAERLFYWAETGTIVEIVSSEYQPQSELGRQILNMPSTPGSHVSTGQVGAM